MEIEELKMVITEQTKGKLSEEQINKIIEKAGLDEVEVKVTSSPYEYGEENVAKTERGNNYSLDETITGVIGDTKGGEYEDPYQGETIDVSADFSLNQVQASVKRGTEYADGEWYYPVTISVYVPEQEYDVETFKELVKRDEMQQLVATIMEQTEGRLSEEQINKIIEKAGLDEVEVKVTSSPYEYGEENVAKTERGNNYSLDETITGVIGDTKGGKYEDPYQRETIDVSADFSLNQVQASVKRGTEYVDGKLYYPVTISVYVPEQEYDVETFKELVERDDAI